MLENVDDVYPLTPMQQLMLMHSLRTPGPSALVNQLHFRLRGILNEQQFRDAWALTIKRHEALRTAFVWEEIPQPIQVVRTTVDPPVRFVDLSGQADADQDKAIRELVHNDRTLGFELREAPLLRVLVVSQSDNDHLLIISRHHLILDLWSAEIVLNDVFQAYDSPESVSAQPTGRFRDYLEWLQSRDPAQSEHYWRQYLANLNTGTLLFGGGAGRSQWSVEGQSVATHTIEPEVAGKLDENARGLGVSTRILVQGMIALTIAALTGKRDIVFGLTVSTRPHQIENVEHVVGLFINNVPVRTIIKEQRLTDWFAEIQHTQSARSAHDHVSPIDIHRWSELSANAEMFDLLVLLQPPLVSTKRLGSFEIEALRGPLDSTLPMTLAAETGAEGLKLTSVYDASTVPETSARGIVEAVAAAIRCAALELPEHVTELEQRIAKSLPDSAFRQTVLEAVSIPNPSRAVRVVHTPVETESDEANTMLRIFRNALGNPAVGLDDDFFALGGTSVQAALAFVEIERCFGKALPLSTLFSAGSVRQLLHALELPTSSTSLVGIQPFGTRPPLVVVSGIHGNVVGVANLSRALGQDQPVFGLQQNRTFANNEDPPGTVQAIAAQYLNDCDVLRQGNAVLLGVCFGANVVLEMARQRESERCAPALVIALDPSVDDGGEHNASAEPASNWASTVSFVLDRIRLAISSYRETRGEERRQWLRDKREMLLNKVRHRSLLHGNQSELRQRRVTAANLAAARDYRPSHYEGNLKVMLLQNRSLAGQADDRLKWV